MIKIFRATNKTTKYELVGEIKGRVRDGVVFVPGDRLKYFKASVVASQYIDAGVRKWLTPEFFDTYTDIRNDPWIVQIYDENGSKLSAGIIDPDSIEYDYAKMEMSFNVVSPLYILEKIGSIGGRNVYEIKPINVSFDTSNAGVAYIDIPKNTAYNSWVLNTLSVEYRDGISKVVSVTDNGATWRIKVNGFRISSNRSLYVKVTKISRGDTEYVIEFEIQSLPTDFFNKNIVAAVPIGFFGGSADQQRANAKLHSFLLTGTKFTVKLPLPSNENDEWSVGNFVYIQIVSVEGSDLTVGEGIRNGNVRLIDKYYFNFDMTGGAHPIDMIIELLKNVSSNVFGATPNVVDATLAGNWIRILEDAVPSAHPSKAFEEILAAAGCRAEVDWTDGDQIPTIKISSMYVDESNPISVSVIESLKKSVPKRKVPGVFVSYRGDNMNKSHKGWINAESADEPPDAEGTIKLRAVVPISWDISEFKDGTKRSRTMDELARLIYNFYTQYSEEWTAVVKYEGGSLAGKAVSLPVQTFDALNNYNPSVLQNTIFYVVEDQTELGSSLHRLKLWKKSGTEPSTTARAVLKGDLGVVLGGSADFSVRLEGTSETIGSVLWEIKDFTRTTTIDQFTGNDTISYTFSSTTFSSGIYTITATVTASDTLSQITSNVHYIVVINPTINFDPPEFEVTGTLRDASFGSFNKIILPTSGKRTGMIYDADPDTYIVFNTSGPYIYNNSFETEDPNNPGKPDGWTLGPTNSYWSRFYVGGNAPNGAYILRLQTTYNDAITEYTAIQTVSYANLAGAPIKLSFFVDFSNVGPYADQYTVRIRAKDGITVLAEKILDNETSLNWKRYFLEFEIPLSESVTYEISVRVTNWLSGGSSPANDARFDFDFFVDTVYDTTRVLVSPSGIAIGSRFGETRITNKKVKISGDKIGANFIQLNTTTQPTPDNNTGALYFDGEKLYLVIVDYKGNITKKIIV